MRFDRFRRGGKLFLWVVFKDFGIDLRVFLEDLGNGGVLEDSSPGTLWLTGRTIDAFLRMYEEHLPIFAVIDREAVDAIHRTDFDTRGVLTISA